ncbi:MAG: metallophosphoesterase [Wenzhouxiangellaceae bacterium]|nr:metallophosphoesterase [Wenzhouxiangellaceae bacterium]
MRLIHLTDPHLAALDGLTPGLLPSKRWLSWLSWQRKRRHRHLRETLDALVGALRGESPDAWAVTGDLCQTGLPGEIAQGRDWLVSLDAPERVLLVPGNHDRFAADSDRPLVEAWAPWLHVDREAPRWPVARPHGPLTLIGVDSAVVTPVLRAGGRVGAAARDRLARCLDSHADSFRVVLIHHPPRPGLCHRRKALADDAEVAALLARHGAGLVLHGHLHAGGEASIEAEGGREIPVLCTGSASETGEHGSAEARIIDVERREGGYGVDMRRVALTRDGALDEVERWNRVLEG